MYNNNIVHFDFFTREKNVAVYINDDRTNSRTEHIPMAARTQDLRGPGRIQIWGPKILDLYFQNRIIIKFNAQT